MAGGPSEEEVDLERIAHLIAELDREAFLLTGLEVGASAETGLAAIRERRARLEEELAEVWAKRCSQC
jgi:hypothetical protein